MTDTATLITQLRILGQLTRTEAQVARQRVVQASTDAVRDDLRQNAADADGRVARIADALRGLGALPDLVTPLFGRVAVLVRGAMEQAQPLDEALLGDLALEHQLRDRARYVAALAAAADVPAVQALAGELEAAHDETVRWLTLGPRGPRRRAGGSRGVAASARRGPGHAGGERSEPAGPRRGGGDGHANRRDGDRSGHGGRQGRQGHRRAVRRPRRPARRRGRRRGGHDGPRGRRAGVGSRGARRRRRGGRRGHRPRRRGTDRRPARPAPSRDPARRTHPRTLGPAADPELIAPSIPGFADLPPHAAVAALRTLDDPRAVAAMLEFEQAHGNRPGVVAAARLRATAVRTG